MANNSIRENSWLLAGLAGAAAVGYYLVTQDKLSNQIEDEYKSMRQTKKTSKIKEDLRKKLKHQLGKVFDVPIELIAFGSSCVNSLALDNSDLDLYLKVEGQQAYVLPPQAILKEFREKIYEYNIDDVRDIPVIVGREKPVMRFEFIRPPMKVDIGIYSENAIRNTNMIARYAEADERFPKLAIILKLWAKAKRINDASQGKLSSYALILLLIQYFQDPRGCNPPIFLPQALGVRTRFKNSTNLGDMLIGFFKYYSNFDFRYSTVTIKFGRPMLRSSHFDDLFSVEEPFYESNVAKSISSEYVYDQIRNSLDSSYSELKRNRDLSRILR